METTENCTTPEAPDPQQTPVPSVPKAQAWATPALTELKRPAGGVA